MNDEKNGHVNNYEMICMDEPKRMVMKRYATKLKRVDQNKQ